MGCILGGPELVDDHTWSQILEGVFYIEKVPKNPLYFGFIHDLILAIKEYSFSLTRIEKGFRYYMLV